MKNIIFALLVLSTVSYGQNLQNTHLFLNSLVDVNENNFIEANVVAEGYANSNRENVGLRGNYNVDNFTFGTELSMANISSSDLTPSFLRFGGRYNINLNTIRISAGGLLDFTFPFDSYGNSFISLFSAVRYQISENIDLSGSLRLGYASPNEDYDELLGFGGIISLYPELNLLTELNYSVELDNLSFGGGLEYELSKMFSLRGGYFSNRYKANSTIFVGLVFNKIQF